MDSGPQRQHSAATGKGQHVDAQETRFEQLQPDQHHQVVLLQEHLFSAALHGENSQLLPLM